LSLLRKREVFFSVWPRDSEGLNDIRKQTAKPLQLVAKKIIFHMHISFLQSSDKKGEINVQGLASFVSACESIARGGLWIFCDWWLLLIAKAAVALQTLRRTCLEHLLLYSLSGKMASWFPYQVYPDIYSEKPLLRHVTCTSEILLVFMAS